MVFEYAVRHNGVDYPAGADVPVGNEAPKKAAEEPKVEEKKVEQAKVEKPAFKQTKKK
jgi:hypothetical protein